MQQPPIEPSTDAALNTGELTRLPAGVQPLMDPEKPLPPEVRFFEQRQTVEKSLKAGAIGVGLIALGIALVFPGVFITFYSAIVGIVFILAGSLMVGSAKTQMQSMQKQNLGGHTRFGVFVTPTAVVLRTELDYTYVPHAAYHDLQGSTLYYRTGDQTKSLTLPDAILGATPGSMQAALREWAEGNAGN